MPRNPKKKRKGAKRSANQKVDEETEGSRVRKIITSHGRQNERKISVEDVRLIETELLNTASTSFLSNELRCKCWTRILNSLASHNNVDPRTEKVRASKSNKVERKEQISKDVQRSIMMYTFSKSHGEIWLENRRALLSEVLNKMFDRNEDLFYYQGFNSVASVYLLLYYNKKLDKFGTSTSKSVSAITTQVAKLLETLARNFMLDHLQSNFNNTIIWLDLLKQLVKMSDIKLYVLFKQIGLNYHFALPWIITWFAHSVPDFKAVLEIYDFCLVSHPLMPIYLAAAWIQNKKIQGQIFEAFSDFGNSSMPEIYGLLQHSTKRIISSSTDEPSIPAEEFYSYVSVSELINGAKSLLAKAPIHCLLRQEVAANLVSSSPVWSNRTLTKRDHERIIERRGRWRKVIRFKNLHFGSNEFEYKAMEKKNSYITRMYKSFALKFAKLYFVGVEHYFDASFEPFSSERTKVTKMLLSAILVGFLGIGFGYTYRKEIPHMFNRNNFSSLIT